MRFVFENLGKKHGKTGETWFASMFIAGDEMALQDHQDHPLFVGKTMSCLPPSTGNCLLNTHRNGDDWRDGSWLFYIVLTVFTHINQGLMTINHYYIIII